MSNQVEADCPRGAVHPLAFGNDISRIVRGIAIILMVVGHSLPGKVIGFAVPLFSFLVGYGYNFSRSHDARHSFSRVWHLLANFWIILFGLCIPAALITHAGPVNLGEVALNMFGLHPRFNFFCWYIYFYIVAMALLPGLSRIIDRHGLRGVILLSLLFGAVVVGLGAIPVEGMPVWGVKLVGCASRCACYMPVVLVGYWIAKNSLYSRSICRRSPWRLALCFAILIGIYFLRGLPWVKALDLIWAPLAAGVVAQIFGMYTLAPLRWLLTFLGMKSMGIWFLHAIFFTHATRKLFVPILDFFTKNDFIGSMGINSINTIRILLIFAVSAMLAMFFDKVYSLLSKVHIGFSHSVATN